MNRRIVVPVLVFGLALCFAVLSSQPITAQNAQSGTEAAVVDPCNPKPQIPGYIVADSVFVFSEPASNSTRLLLVKKNDLVDVLGRSQTAPWYFIKSNSGITGWVPSAYIQIAPKLLAKLEAVTTTGTNPNSAAATEAATAEGTAEASSCAGVPGTIVADLINMRAAPSQRSAEVGHKLKKGDAIEVIGLNSSGSWAKVRATGDEGWIGIAYIFTKPGALVNTPHDFSDVEVTLTPSGSK